MSGNTDAESSSTLHSAEPLPEHTPAKTFKACRLCRKMKMRCEGNENPPCKRCNSSGHECIFDHVEPARKRKHTEDEDLREEVQKLKRRIASLTGTRHSYTPLDHNMRCDTATPQLNDAGVSGRDFTDPDGFSPDQLSAPVTAVHEMTPNSISHVVSKHADLMRPKDLDVSPHHSLNNSFGGLTNPADDAFTKHSIDEDQAHALFNMYMTGSNPYLPLFEPTLDTFERIRASSAFLLASILSVSSRNDRNLRGLSKIFQDEAHSLAATSLFENPVQLETVQAMLILAAWSEKSWFAFGHASNMALDLGIDKAFSKLTKNSPSNEKGPKSLARETRTWLILYHLEREIAFGTARKSRFACIDEAKLRGFLHHPCFRHLDLRFMSIIELVQLREKWQNNVDKSTDLTKNATILLRRAEDGFTIWRTFWDQQHEDYGYDDSSFQITSLTVQTNYAIILVCCGVLSKLQRQKSTNRDTELTQATFKQFSDQTLTAVINHLQFILDKETFKWHLKFAPTYSALTIAFSVALGITLAKAFPGSARQRSLISTTHGISALLAEYPNQKFHVLVESLLNQLQGSVGQAQPVSTDGTVPAPDSTRRSQSCGMPLPELFAGTNSEDRNSQYYFQPRINSTELQDAQYTSSPKFHDKELEAILELPAESWLFDPFSADVFSLEGS